MLLKNKKIAILALTPTLNLTIDLTLVLILTCVPSNFKASRQVPKLS